MACFLRNLGSPISEGSYAMQVKEHGCDPEAEANMDINANDQQLLQEDMEREQERAEQDLRRRVLWRAMEDEPTAVRLLEIAKEHAILNEKMYSLRAKGLEFRPNDTGLKLSVETVRARIAQLAKEREKLIEPFYEECV